MFKYCFVNLIYDIIVVCIYLIQTRWKQLSELELKFFCFIQYNRWKSLVCENVYDIIYSIWNMISYIQSIRDKILSIFSYSAPHNTNSWLDWNSIMILYMNNLMAHLWYKLWAPKTIWLRLSINSIVIQRH